MGRSALGTGGGGAGRGGFACCTLSVGDAGDKGSGTSDMLAELDCLLVE